MSRELFLYSRENCELCDKMHSELQAMLEDQDVLLHTVDITSDAELLHRYGARIPVLVAGNREICEIKLDTSALQSFLGAP